MDYEYQVSSVNIENYADTNGLTAFMYLTCQSNPIVRLQMEITGLGTEQELMGVVRDFNNPFRLKDTYKVTDIKKEDKVFVSSISRYGFEGIVKCVNEEYLSDFLYFINNPPEVSSDLLLEEHKRLSGLIDKEVVCLMNMLRERQFLEYKMWGYSI